MPRQVSTIIPIARVMANVGSNVDEILQHHDDVVVTNKSVTAWAARRGDTAKWPTASDALPFALNHVQRDAFENELR